MPTAHISIAMDNAAFDDDEPGHGCATELARILRRLAKHIEAGDLPPINLRDLNGNTVGTFTIDNGRVGTTQGSDEARTRTPRSAHPNRGRHA